MAPPQARAWVMRQHKRQQAKLAAHKLEAVVDTTPPALAAFDAPMSVDVGIPNNPPFIATKAADDLSGVHPTAWARVASSSARR